MATSTSDKKTYDRQQMTRANHAVYDPIFIQYIIISAVAVYEQDSGGE
jgi:hypothetical protein